MSLKINSDLDRFKEILKGKLKENLKKFVSHGSIIGKQGSKIIKIPIHTIDLPRFTYGSRGQGGTGMGDGLDGDPMDGKGKSKGSKPGEETEEHGIDLSTDELAKIMIDHLELPNLENKGKGSVQSEKNKYNSISNNGSEGLRHFKRTYKQALKRQISTGSYDPNDPKIIPVRDDKRYKHFSVKETPEVDAVVFNIMDCSGSMEDQQRHMVKSMVFWTDLLLNHTYGDIENVFIIHDTTAKVVSREDFFKISSAGGTKISSAYRTCAELIETEYPHSEYNNYIFAYSDGGNYSGADNDECGDLLINRILPNCNAFSYGQVKSDAGGDFIDYLGARLSGNDKVNISSIDSEEDLLKTIKLFFEKGK